MQDLIDCFKENGYIIKKINDVKPLIKVREIVRKYFPEGTVFEDTAKFRERLLLCQTEVNKLSVHRDILQGEKELFKLLFSDSDLSCQSVCYLRGVRPNSQESVECLGFHRESFYGDESFVRHQINIIAPIFNFNEKTSVKFVEGSHLISSDDILLEKLSSEQSGVERFSTGHRLGLTYNPKKIIGGVPLQEAKRVNISTDEIFIFNTELIHGEGDNLSDEIRFSLDFGIIPTRLVEGKMKKEHFASYHKSKSHYLPV